MIFKIEIPFDTISSIEINWSNDLKNIAFLQYLGKYFGNYAVQPPICKRFGRVGSTMSIPSLIFK